MKNGAVFSALLHVAVIVAAVLGLPSLWTDEPLIVHAITVEMVTLAKETAAPEIDPEPAPAKPEPEPEPPKETKTPPPPPPVVADVPPPPIPEKAPEPKPEPKPKKKVEKKPDATKPPQNLPKMKPKMKVRKKKEPKDLNFDSVLQSVAETEPAKQAAPQTATAIGTKLTISELDAIKYQIGQCWNIPAGARDAENLIIELSVDMNPNATVRQVRLIDSGGLYNSDSFYRAAADSAMRAVLNPRCSPLKLPLDKYKTWSTFTFNFNPKDMF